MSFIQGFCTYLPASGYKYSCAFILSGDFFLMRRNLFTLFLVVTIATAPFACALSPSRANESEHKSPEGNLVVTKYLREMAEAEKSLRSPNQCHSDKLNAKLGSITGLVWNLYGCGARSDSETLTRQVLSIRALRTQPPDKWWWWQDSLARIYIGEGKAAEAEKAAQELVALAKRTNPLNEGLLCKSLNELAIACWIEHKTREAIHWQELAVSLADKTAAPDEPVFWQLQLAQWLYDHGDVAAPRSICELLLACEGRFREPQLTQALILLSSMSVSGNKFAEADQYLKRACELVELYGAPDSWDSAEAASKHLSELLISCKHSNAKVTELIARIEPLKRR
jgi:hypothetical protein